MQDNDKIMTNHIICFINIFWKLLYVNIKKKRCQELGIICNVYNFDNDVSDYIVIDKINKFAPIKHILKNKLDNENAVIEILEDINRDLNNYDLEYRIQELESKFSKDLSEVTFNELKELKIKQNIKQKTGTNDFTL